MTPAERIAALELEFDRLKERQDWLDKTLQGDPDAWIKIIERMPDHVGEVVIDKAVSEARQGALAMATVVKTLAQLGESAVAEPVADPVDKLAQKRAAKLAQAAQ